jgi:tight adherence protein C
MSAAGLLAGLAAFIACLAAGGRRRRSNLLSLARGWLARFRSIRRVAPGGTLARLASARDPLGLGQRTWLAAKSLGAVAGLAAGAVVTVGAPGRIAFVLVPGAAVAGFLSPDLWLARWTRRRAQAAVQELPDMLDLLRVTVEAGLPPARALGAVGAEFSGPLAREWRRVASEIALGLPQDQAVAGMAQRLDAEEVRLLTELLTRGRRHGAPLGRALAAQASRARHRRRQHVHEQAAHAGPKIQLVVALLLVPSVLLLVAAGLVAELQRSGLGLPS